MGSTSPQLDFLNRRPAAQTRLACFPIDLVFFLHGAIFQKHCCRSEWWSHLFNSLSKHSNRFFADYFGFSSSQAFDPNGLDEPWLDKGPHLT